MKFIAVLILSIFTTAAFGQTPGCDAAADRAARLAADKQYRRALDETDAALVRDPGCHLLYLSRARVFAAAGDPKSAAADVARALALRPADAVVLAAAARHYYDQEQFAPAADAAARLIALAPRDPLGYDLRARALAGRREYRAAFEDALRSVELTPLEARIDSAQLLLVLGVGLRDDANVFAYFDRTLALLDRRFAAVGELPARPSLFRDEKKPKLLANERQAEVFPHILLALLNEIELAERKGLTDRAERLLKRIGEYEPRHRTLPIRASYYAARGRYAEAIADLTAAIALQQEDTSRLAQSFFKRGEIYEQMKRYEKAMTDFETAELLDRQFAALAKGRISKIRQMVPNSAERPR